MDGEPKESNVIPFRKSRRMSAAPLYSIREHTWGPSQVGHGEAQCTNCLMTNREAAVLGRFCISGKQ